MAEGMNNKGSSANFQSFNPCNFGEDASIWRVEKSKVFPPFALNLNYRPFTPIPTPTSPPPPPPPLPSPLPAMRFLPPNLNCQPTAIPKIGIFGESITSTPFSYPQVIRPSPPKFNIPSRKDNSGAIFCVFCKNNRTASSTYMSHTIRDNDNKITCPLLRAYVCPVCFANGDNAHTIRYCPLTMYPHLLQHVTFSHWVSLPIKTQIRLATSAKENGLNLIEPVHPQSKLARLGESPQYKNKTIVEVITMLRNNELELI
ncbi:DgyrCDS8215 [Dimorphilus gyrociliatus]|uniref:DgyrCDS8215 n=1 Tax=Dimorphilus gyrociliatus TaxID=2664684 RepID=A0A7I8VTH1_9ANNE|nr:DgyrCDS8215 [Dimorphilus gyrociliatus]